MSDVCRAAVLSSVPAFEQRTKPGFILQFPVLNPRTLSCSADTTYM